MAGPDAGHDPAARDRAADARRQGGRGLASACRGSSTSRCGSASCCWPAARARRTSRRRCSGVAFAYGLARVDPTVTFTLLGISYQPSADRAAGHPEPYGPAPRHRLHPAGRRLPPRRRDHRARGRRWRRRTGGWPTSGATGTRTAPGCSPLRPGCSRARRACWSAAGR